MEKPGLINMHRVAGDLVGSAIINNSKQACEETMAIIKSSAVIQHLKNHYFYDA
jgi:hypothetical protein